MKFLSLLLLGLLPTFKLFPFCGASCLPEEGIEIFPESGPAVCTGADFAISTSYLYWTAREEGLAYLFTGVRNNTTTPLDRGEVYDPDFKYRSGFKVELSTILPHDGWHLGAEYTWFHTVGTRTRVRKANPDLTMRRLFYPGGDLSPFFLIREGDGKWKLHFNSVDLMLSRPFFVSSRLSLTPAFGLKGTWQRQDYLVRYVAVDSEFITRNERVHIDQFYWGVGPRAECDAQFHLKWGFSLLAKGALSALWGAFDSERRDRVFVNTLTLFPLTVDNDFHTVRPALEIFAGLNFDHWFCCDTYHIAISLGYESQIWFHQNALYRTLEQVGHGDLGLAGLSAKIRFDF